MASRPTDSGGQRIGCSSSARARRSTSSRYASISAAQRNAGGPIATGIHSGISGSATLTCSAARYASGEAKSK